MSKQEKPKCISSYVLPTQQIFISGFEHAGVVTHSCQLPQGHADLCKCGCGQQWKKFNDVK